MSTCTTLSDALWCPSSGPLLDVAVVVVDVSVDTSKRRGVISAIDASIDEAVGISVHGSTLLELLSSLSPGCILLLSGLEANREAKYLFRLSAMSFTSTAAIQVLNDDELHYKHDHENADSLIALSHRIKNQCLAQPSCCRRTLADIQCPGQLSSVEVRVVSCEALSTTTALFHSRKRGRQTSRVFATLADNDARMVLVDCRKYFKDLKTAQEGGDSVQITNLLSCQEEAGEIVLKPTIRTLILPTKRPRRHVSRVHNEPQSILLEQSCIISSMEAIFIDELNQALDSKHFVSPSAFVGIIINKVGPCYRAATLTLEGARVVKANPSVMKVLCASIDAGQVLADTQTRQDVLELVRGILMGATQLKWTLDGNVVQKLEIPRC